jgi:phage/plasmid-like protein (TIGR03299 family)
MAANIAKINGKDAVVLARQPAWHGLGTVVDHLMKAEEAFKQAQLDWQVEKRPLYSLWPDGSYWKTDASGIFRMTDNALLGTCGEMYKPIQNASGFELIDALLELSDGGMYYETAGALGKGEVVWALARIPEEFKIAGGDLHSLYLMFMTRHDGNGSARCKLVDTRVVCQNTLAVAIGEKGGELRIAHFGNVDEKIAAAKKLMAATGETVKALETKLNILATRQVTKDAFFATLDELFPVEEEKKESPARMNKVSDVMELFASNDHDANPAIRGTGLNLLNCIVEYMDHVSGSDKMRGRSAMFGSGSVVKEKALEVILQTTAGAPVRQVLYSKPSDSPTAPAPILDAIVDASVTVN